MEFFGLARRGDVGVLPIMVLERKAMRTPGSPTRKTRRDSLGSQTSAMRWEDENETVVSRYEIEGEFVLCSLEMNSRS
jgi:hypothetical protein